GSTQGCIKQAYNERRQRWITHRPAIFRRTLPPLPPHLPSVISVPPCEHCSQNVAAGQTSEFRAQLRSHPIPDTQHSHKTHATQRIDPRNVPTQSTVVSPYCTRMLPCDRRNLR